MAPPGESAIENTKRNSFCSNSSLLLFSPLFTQTTFLKTSSMRKKHGDFVPPPPPPIIYLRDIHNSVVSTADKCFRFLRLIAFENPLSKTLLGVPSQVHSLCHQICCRKSRNFNRQGLSNHNFAAVLPGDSVAGLVVANGISNFLNIYNTLLVVRLVLTWFPNSPPAIVSPLSTICDPYLNIFRGLIPPLGGTLDLSPILAFLVLNAFTSTASALPAELPLQDDNTHHTSQKHPRPSSPFSHLSSSQEKWFRRLHGSKTNKEC